MSRFVTVKPGQKNRKKPAQKTSKKPGQAARPVRRHSPKKQPKNRPGQPGQARARPGQAARLAILRLKSWLFCFSGHKPGKQKTGLNGLF